MNIDYPERLLPNSDRLANFNVSGDCFLCRRSIEKEKIYDDDNEVEEAALEIEKFLDYSLNAVNAPGVSNSVETIEEDVLIEVEDTRPTYTEFKKGDESKVPPVQNILFKIRHDLGFVKFTFSEAQIKASFPFTRQGKKVPESFDLEVCPVHKPNLINIVHFEFRCVSDFVTDKMEVVKPGSIKINSYREQIVHIIRDELRVKINRRRKQELAALRENLDPDLDL
jgi:hypothetical protein